MNYASVDSTQHECSYTYISMTTHLYIKDDLFKSGYSNKYLKIKNILVYVHIFLKTNNKNSLKVNIR